MRRTITLDRHVSDWIDRRMEQHDATASRIIERAVREFAARHGDHLEVSRFAPTGIILEASR